MNINAGQSITELFTITDADDLPAAADALPTGTVYHDGAEQLGVAVTVAALKTGVYKAEYDVAADVPAGTVIGLEIFATVGGADAYKVDFHPHLVVAPAAEPAVQLAMGPYLLSALNPALSGTAKLFVGEAVSIEFGLTDGQGRPVSLGAQTATVACTDTAGASGASLTGTVVYADGGRVRVTGTAPAAAGTYALSIELSGGDVFDGFTLLVRER